jgi:dTDP-4-amino-4,6-dideoxygalactose transaminase
MLPRFNEDYDFKDFMYSIKSTFRRDDVESTLLRSMYGGRNFFFTNTGRTSLYVILNALNLPKGSNIGVPLYSCTVVFDAIIKAGYIPYFIDINLDNYTLDSKDLAEKIDNLDAIVVIHTFGRPADMDRIKEVAGDVPIIEDCAHSLLSEYKGKQTGILGVASFFSLKKYLSNGGGGMIILNNDEFMGEFKKEIYTLDSFTAINEIKDDFMTCTYSFLYHRPWFGLFAYPVGFYLRSMLDRNEGIKDFRAKKIRKTNFYSLFNKLNKFKRKVELQRKNSFFLIEKLRDTQLILPYEKKDTYCNYYLFPIRFGDGNERDKAYEHLHDMGVDTAKLYGETPVKSKRFYGYKEDCPNSEITADTILIIPNYYTLNETDLMKIANSVKKMGELL